MLVAVVASCYPNGPESTEEFDVVVTGFDITADFGAFTTYAMPDSVVSLTGEDGQEHDHSLDAGILAKIAENMGNRGYTRIPEQDLDTTTPDMIVLPGIATFKNYNAYTSYPWYGSWGWWGGWGYPGGGNYGSGWGIAYPWYNSSVIYSYEVGTLAIVIIDPDNFDAAEENIRALWSGAANGLVDPQATGSRLDDAIDQMFVQSPYLESNP